MDFNPILRNKTTLSGYIVAVIVYAMIYSFTIALAAGYPHSFSISYILYDTITVAVVIGITGILIWSVTRYGILQTQIGAYKVFFITLITLFCVIVVNGIESVTMWIVSAEIFPLFAKTIPIRIFIVLLSFSALSLFYLQVNNLQEKEEAQEKAEAIREVSSPQNATIEENISVREGSKIKIIPVGEIEYIRADGDYVSITTAEGHWLKEQTMKYYEEHLPQNKFVRIHRSYIINISFLSRIERYGQQQSLTMRSGEHIRVSAGGYRLLKSKLG
ncbi:MAG: LytTR family DNA-binding domain-containing protein [Bacteroidales bacterium]|nr:LytTR family DNA-binding domain-containing protein [Bacteroidales bacterium]